MEKEKERALSLCLTSRHHWGSVERRSQRNFIGRSLPLSVTVCSRQIRTSHWEIFTHKTTWNTPGDYLRNEIRGWDLARMCPLWPTPARLLQRQSPAQHREFVCYFNNHLGLFFAYYCIAVSVSWRLGSGVPIYSHWNSPKVSMMLYHCPPGPRF